MMNELLELELWRIIGQDNDNSGRGYSGGGRAMLHGRVHLCSLLSRSCYFDRLDHGRWARACRTLVLNSQFQPQVIDIGVSHVNIAWPWKLIEFTLLIPAINFINIRFKTSTIYLKSAKFGMNYLDCTIWENTEYRKRDCSVRFRGDNTRVCYI
ncbi:hypothetical protein GOBAR_AA18650 [Gossypium barbadense]|uniref:Uncharacterized protein n=1 Tax=Gossypium barbadense TaxID=3634 RepID=A0A2P5XFC5_GOSBA|nr:hypothetical protein GOBAR_AA18650 [Gossypium barbadense]